MMSAEAMVNAIGIFGHVAAMAWVAFMVVARGRNHNIGIVIVATLLMNLLIAFR